MTTGAQGHEPTDEQKAEAQAAREKRAAEREERDDASEGPSSSEVSGEDPAAEVAETHEQTAPQGDENT